MLALLSNDFDDSFAFLASSLLVECFVGLLVNAVVCTLLYRIVTVIPERHRRIEPNPVWILMIPVFGLVWNFVVFPKVSDSLRAALDEVRPTHQQGDCGRSLGLVYCVASILAWIPCLGYLAGTVALVVLVIYLIRASEAKRLLGG